MRGEDLISENEGMTGDVLVFYLGRDCALLDKILVFHYAEGKWNLVVPMGAYKCRVRVEYRSHVNAACKEKAILYRNGEAIEV